MNNILISMEKFPPDYTGAGIRALKTIKRMSERNNSSFNVLALKNSKSQNKELTNNVSRINVLTPKIIFPVYLLELIIKVNIYLYKNRTQIDIIHFYSFFWLNRIVMLSNLLFYHKKTVLEITLFGDDDPVNLINKNALNKILGPITTYLIKKIDKIVALNKDSLNSCLNMNISSDKIWLRPNPIDDTVYNYVSFKNKLKLRKKLNLPNKFIALNIGAIQPRKNQIFLVKVIEQLKHSDLVLVLIGPTDRDKEYYENLIKYVRKNNLINNVIILGEINNINEYLSASDLFVFASEREGFSNAIGESLMSGLPVLTLHHHNIDTFINKKSGIIIKSKNVQSAFNDFTQSLRDIYSGKILFNPKEIRLQAIKMFSASKIDKEYERIYQQLKTGNKK